MQDLFDLFDQSLIPFILGTIGGVVRTLFRYLGGESMTTARFVAYVLMAGLLGVIAGLFAPLVSDKIEVQYGIIYLAGILATEVIRVLIDRIPNLLSKKIDNE